MFKDKEDEALVTLAVQAIGAGCALIGLIANPDVTDATKDTIADLAWTYGDLMAAQFMRRAKEVKENQHGK